MELTITDKQKEFLHLCIIEQLKYDEIAQVMGVPRQQLTKWYDDLDNLVFACYWCNNAKTDTFTFEEFKQVGEVFRNIWQKRLENDTRQPNQ
jgi:hypothetical protein